MSELNLQMASHVSELQLLLQTGDSRKAISLASAVGSLLNHMGQKSHDGNDTAQSVEQNENFREVNIKIRKTEKIVILITHLSY